MKNKLKGGKADRRKLSSFDQKELNMGAKEESSEHTYDKDIAKEIAADHLTEDPHYYSKMKKEEVRMPDGSIKRVAGELMEKDPALLKTRWQQIREMLAKAAEAVVSNKSIPDMSELMKPDTQEDGDVQAPEENAEDQAPDDSAAEMQDQSADAQTSDDASAPAESSDDTATPEDQPEDMSDDELIQAMKDEGYSDQEIGFILWGHHTPTDSLQVQQDHAHEMVNQDPQDPEHDEDNREDVKGHLKAMRDVELAHAKAKDPTPDVEMMRAHKKAMLELEREKAKRLMEMEIKHKEHELAMKRMEMTKKLKEKSAAPKGEDK